MKHLVSVVCFGAVLLLTFFCGCSTYYYSTIHSNDTEGIQTATHHFVQENEDLCILYNFSGENIPLQISIRNKTDEPVYVDWQRSQLLIDGKSIPFYQDRMSAKGRINPDFSGDNYDIRHYYRVSFDESPESLSGAIRVPRTGEVIPPQAILHAALVEIDNFQLKNRSAAKYHVHPFAKNDASIVFLPVCSFEESDSPLQFTTVLAVYPVENQSDPENCPVYERSFFVQHIVEGGNLKPADFPAVRRHDGHVFYQCNHKVPARYGVFRVITSDLSTASLNNTLTPDEED